MIYIFLLLAITQTNGQSAVCVFEGDGNGEVIGLVMLKEVEEGSETELTVEISGLSPGQHGFHIHQEGGLASHEWTTGISLARVLATGIKTSTDHGVSNLT